MSLSEFELIQQCFAERAATSSRSGTKLGIGDDCAIVSPPAEHDLLVSVDTLVAEVHFPDNLAAAHIAQRALAANLSDLAAMGAMPAWFTLALTLPESDEAWLLEFSQGLFGMAEEYGIHLVGGDTTRGPLSVTIQVIGHAPAGEALRRDGARVGDLICVSGALGDAGAGLAIALNDEPHEANFLFERFVKPSPRLLLGQSLRAIASSAIDVSDGLLADLKHVLKRSNVGARLYSEKVPLSAELINRVGRDEAQRLALTAGDDYELCFTVPANRAGELDEIAARADVVISVIGEIITEPHLELLDAKGQPVSIDETGYQHF